MWLKRKRPEFIPILIAAGVLAIVCSIALLPETGTLLRLEGITYDARVKFASRYPRPVATNLATLFFDDIAFQHMNSGAFSKEWRFMWPWPRFIHGRIVRELKAQGAACIGFDVLFPEEYAADDNTDVEIEPGKKISSDQFFAEQIAAAQNVTLAAEHDLLPHPTFASKAAALGNVSSEASYGVIRQAKAFTEMRVWNERIIALKNAFKLDLDRPAILSDKIVFKSTMEGTTNEVLLKKDGTLDLEALGGDANDPPEKPFRKERIWNLGIVLAAKSLDLDLDKAEVAEDHIRFTGRNGVERILPVDRDANFYVDWSLKWSDIKQPGNSLVYPGNLGEILLQDHGRVLGEKDLGAPFTNKIVLIGSTAMGNNIRDRGTTPLEEDSVLPMQHLNVANSFLMNAFVQRASPVATALIILALGAISATLTWRPKVSTAMISVFGVGLIYLAFTFWIFLQNRYWLPVALPLGGGLLLPHFAMLSYRLVFEQREQRRVKAVFSKIVSPAVVHELLGAEKLALGGARRDLSIYFADVRGFTEFTDNSQANAEEYVRKNQLTKAQAEAYFDQIAADNLATVNLYLGTIADVIKKHQGTLDKYIGDCVMAFWGAPVATPDHALIAVRSAIEAQRALASLNQKRYAENERIKNENINRLQKDLAALPLLPILNMGSGVNTGTATVGLMGSDAHILNYTVFGREVNIAARLESVAKRGSIIISEATYQEIVRCKSEIASICLELPPVNVKGIRQPIRIYEIQWKKSAGPSDVLTEDFNTVRFTKPAVAVDKQPEGVKP